MILFIDAETSTYNRGNPFDTRNKLVSYAYIINDLSCVFKYFTDPDFVTVLREVVHKATIICGFNIKFDLHWFASLGIWLRPDQQVWDCQIAEFILNCQEKSYLSLNEALESYGLPVKKDVIKEYWDAGISTEDIPYTIVEEYNKWDVAVTKMLYEAQQSVLSDKQKKLVFLEGEDLKALQHAEFHGVKFDVEKAKALLDTQRSIVSDCERTLNQYLPSFPVGVTFNWDSGDQLSAFLYGGFVNYDYAVPETKVYQSGAKKGETYIRNSWHTHRSTFVQRFVPLADSEVAKTIDNPPDGPHYYQTDVPTLKQLKARSKETQNILHLLGRRSEAIKVAEMAESIMKKITDMNWADNIIHAQFNQTVARTGRLSSSAPNMQNTPIEIDELLVTRYDS